MRTAAALLAAAVGVTLLALGFVSSRAAGESVVITHDAAAAAPSPAPDLATSIRTAAAAAGADTRVGVVVVDLSGPAPRAFRYGADDRFTAASTYKLPALMDEAERVAAGTVRTADSLCFHSSQAEDGWFSDYQDGSCLSVQEVATRAGTYSDNTAAHMLVDSLGGTDALNAYAHSRGAVESAFYAPNQTTASDLATLWTAEATGQAGGTTAQAWLYPLLTHTRYEDGIPAGVPPAAGATVVHKVGFIDQTVNDAGLVTAGGTRYVVAITTDGLGGDAGWALVARISALVWAQETGTLAR